MTYVGDFSYIEDGRRVVEDAKGMRTRDYIIKRKLMLEKHGITVREV
ncbi:PF06356 domain protein [Bordetella bronchiseptica OSU095]|nr:PF06356 domain protein [Bordetella bronchiseptica OSU095]